MFASLRQNFSAATLAQLAVELLWLFAAGAAVLHLYSQLNWPARSVVVPALVFAIPHPAAERRLRHLPPG